MTQEQQDTTNTGTASVKSSNDHAIQVYMAALATSTGPLKTRKLSENSSLVLIYFTSFDLGSASMEGNE